MPKLDTPEAVARWLGLPPDPPQPMTAEEIEAAFEDGPPAAPWTDDQLNDFADDYRPTPTPKPRKIRRRR